MNKLHEKRPWLWAVGLAGMLLWGSVSLASDRDKPSGDFSTILGEMTSAVGHVDDIQKRADRIGDRILVTCAYERLRNMMQAVDTTQIARVNWEGAQARGDAAGAARELTRAQDALRLVRNLRNEADNCVGRELGRFSASTDSTKTLVTVESNVDDDDPNAGPSENWAIRPPRLELAVGARPLPASPF